MTKSQTVGREEQGCRLLRKSLAETKFEAESNRNWPPVVKRNDSKNRERRVRSTNMDNHKLRRGRRKTESNPGDDAANVNVTIFYYW